MELMRVVPDIIFGEDDYTLSYDFSFEVYKAVSIEDLGKNYYRLSFYSNLTPELVAWELGSLSLEGSSVVFLKTEELNHISVSVVFDDFTSYSNDVAFRVGYRELEGKEGVINANQSSLVVTTDPMVMGLDNIERFDLGIENDFLCELRVDMSGLEAGGWIDVNGLMLSFVPYSKKTDNIYEVMFVDGDINSTLVNLIQALNTISDPRFLLRQLSYTLVKDGILYISGTAYSDAFDSYTLCSSVHPYNMGLNGHKIDSRITIASLEKDRVPVEEVPVGIGWNYKVAVNFEYDVHFFGKPSPIFLEQVSLSGKWNAAFSNQPELYFEHINQMQILKPANTFKVYNLKNIEVLTWGETENRYLDVEFRFSHDEEIWSDWMLLDRDSNGFCRDLKINPIRLFYVEYRITRKGTDPSGVIILYDIVLVGDIINVDCNYEEMGIMGIKDCCSSSNNQAPVANTSLGKKKDCSNTFAFQIGDDKIEQGAKLSGLDIDGGVGCENEEYFNPYANMEQLANVYNQINNDVSKVYGHKVRYARREYEEGGVDMLLNEVSLKYTKEIKDIQVMVPDNAFPEDDYTFDIFDIGNLVDFEVHITKQEFKRIFGRHQYPRKHDVLYFCDWNRLFEIEFAQEFKQFMNIALYYKIHLVKYQDRSMVNKDRNPDAQAEIDALIANKNMEIFKKDVESEGSQVANDKQLLEKNFNPHRDMFHREKDSVKSVSDVLEFDGRIVSKYRYNFADAPIKGASAIRYKPEDICDRGVKSFHFWFNASSSATGEPEKIFSFLMKNNMDFFYHRHNFYLEIEGRKTPLRVRGFRPNIWYVFYFEFDFSKKLLNFQSFQKAEQDNRDVLRAGMELKKIDISALKTSNEYHVEFYANLYELTKIVYLEGIQGSKEALVTRRLIEDNNDIIFVDEAYPEYFLEKAGRQSNKDVEIDDNKKIL